MADVAQLVEHLVVAQVVVGSSPIVRPNHRSTPTLVRREIDSQMGR